ncbi:hypothetical protein NCCP2716_01160 [Sporosarcina sp. NCCP-2716]|nr:hypothetical protein NCCP2716_01160 [Sporosarcina sp. NCCP-2716]
MTNRLGSENTKKQTLGIRPNRSVLVKYRVPTILPRVWHPMTPTGLEPASSVVVLWE